MSSVIRAVLSNGEHPEYGQITVPFPIPNDQYDRIMDMLRELDIGDPKARDCCVDEIDSYYKVLQQLHGQDINVDEMDYLAKRLDSFFTGEADQFQGMAAKLELTDMTDFINLTFCCQNATVITDFSNLEQIGKDHFMNLNGGACRSEDLDNLDGVETAYLLITETPATVTPFGVVYDNGMQLEQVYDGLHFPEYWYGDTNISVMMLPVNGKDSVETCLQFPMPDSKIGRVMIRAGVHSPEEMQLRFSSSEMPDEVDASLIMEHESLRDINRMARVIKGMNEAEQEKLAAVIAWAKPTGARQVANLAESLELFDFAPKVRNAEEYGKYMIQESGHFEFDENLEDYYNYEAYGRDQMASESGTFTHRGYVSYHGELSLDELMFEGPREQAFEMGGMSM